MKKKILFALLLVAVFTLVLAFTVSAETPSLYIEFGVRVEGSDAYVTAYTVNGESDGNPRIRLDNPFYLDIDFTQEIDKSTITGLDFSNATAYGGGTKVITRMSAASSAATYAKCTELKMPSNTGFVIDNVMFKDWASLKKVDIGTCTKLDYSAFEFTGIEELVIPSSVTYIGNNCFNNCTSLKTVTMQVANPSLGTSVFKNCSALTTVNMSGTSIAKIPESMFNGCSALTTVDLSGAPITEIGKFAFSNCASLKTVISSGINQEGAVIIPEGVTWIGQEAFCNCDSIKYLSLPSTVTYLGPSIIRDSSGLEFVDFNENANAINLDNWGHFNNCSSLKAASLPDGLKIINNRFMNNCGNLQAVYLPANLEQMNTNNNGQGPFCFDGKMYFVSEPFEVRDENGYFLGDSFQMPEKPEIYYMPSNLSKAGGNVGSGTWFRDCISLNNVIVFSENFTESTVVQMFRGTASSSQRKTVVYLGKMTNYAWSEMNKYIDFVFAHPENTDLSTLTFTSFYNRNNEKCYFHFCATGNKYTMDKASVEEIAATLEKNFNFHVKEKTLATEADCVNPKMVADYCFCGAIMGTPVTEGVALGHNYIGEVSYSFDSLITAGSQCTVCVNGCGIDEVKEIGAVYTALGYSVKTFGTQGYAFINGYYVNTDSLAKYQEAKGVSLEFGFAFNAANGFTNGDVTLDSFKIVAPAIGKAGDTVFGVYQYQMGYANADHLDSDLVIAAYVIEKSEGGEALTFINRANGSVNGFDPISYNKALELAE